MAKRIIVTIQADTPVQEQEAVTHLSDLILDSPKMLAEGSMYPDTTPSTYRIQLCVDDVEIHG